MSAIDNTAELESLAAELTTPVHERAVEEDQDDVSRYAEYQARTIAGAEPVPHSGDAEAEDAADDDVQPDMTGEKRVPLKALQSERQKRQQLQAQLQQLQAAAQQQDQQFRAWAAQVQQQAQLAGQQAQQQPVQPQQLPDFAEDPEGHVKALQQQLQAVQQQQASQQHQQAAAAQEAHVRQTIAANAQAIAAEVEPLEREFKQANPDFDDAFAHLARVADQQIAEKYPHVPAAQREMVKVLALSQLHERCRQTGENVCAVLYREALALGYQARAVAQQGARRLDNLSLADVASMDDAAFDALWKDMQWSGYVQPKVG